ncbi:MAG: haloacid dehalogenase [Desulfobacteraceae bacterium]|jgi:uncharacterized HAD superfamily protein
MKILPNEIAFDIDGVFADTFRVFVEKAREEYGYQFDYEDITEYDFTTVVDIDQNAREAIIHSLIAYPIRSGIKPIAGAVEFLTRLSLVGPLVFVTARPDRDPILGWIQHQLPQVDGDLIHLEVTHTYQNKPSILQDKGVRYFVEDRLETCYLLQEYAITPIVFDQPWNRKNHPFLVVKNWEDISVMIGW